MRPGASVSKSLYTYPDQGVVVTIITPSTARDKSPAPKTPFRTLDLVGAQAVGWDAHVGISHRESQVLTFIALRGKHNEPGVAFAWFPIGGQEWWAGHLGMPGTALRKALQRLRGKGLVVNLTGSHKDKRFAQKRGYAIPVSIMEDAVRWYADRQDMSNASTTSDIDEYLRSQTECDTTSHDSPDRVTPCHIPCDTLSHANPHSPAASRAIGFLPYIEPLKRETRILTDARSPAGCSPSPPTGGLMKDQEGAWDVPRDEVDDGFAVPKEAREKPPSYHRPSTRIMEVFEQRWLKSRERIPMLSIPWKVRPPFARNLNLLRKLHTDDEIIAMVERFFVLVDSRGVVLKSDELWRDFWYQRDKIYRLVIQSAPPRSAEDYATLRAAEIERNERKEAARRHHRGPLEES